MKNDRSGKDGFNSKNVNLIANANFMQTIESAIANDNNENAIPKDLSDLMDATRKASMHAKDLTNKKLLEFILCTLQDDECTYQSLKAMCRNEHFKKRLIIKIEKHTSFSSLNQDNSLQQTPTQNFLKYHRHCFQDNSRRCLSSPSKC